MTGSLRLTRNPAALFLLLTIGIYSADSLAVRLASDPSRRMLVAAGASLDLVLVVGLLYYWLLVRPGLRPRAGLVFIGVMGLMRASFLFPQGALVKAALAGCAEIGLIAFVAVQVARSRRPSLKSDNPLQALRSAVAAVIPFPAAARAIATEMSLMYYATFGWRAKPQVPPGMRAFWLREQQDKAFLLAAVGLASVFEIVPVHLLVARWSTLAAWILTAVSLYGMVWLLGLSRSLLLLPTILGPDSLEIRYGMLARLQVQQGDIAQVERVTEASPDAIVLPRRMTPNLQITFSQPIKLERLFGSRLVSRIAVYIENEEEFIVGASRGFRPVI